MSDTPVTPISERIRQALEGTTPGPWSSTRDTDDHFVYQPDGRGPGRSRAVGTAGTTANARLIAAAPTLLADALAEIDRLTIEQRCCRGCPDCMGIGGRNQIIGQAAEIDRQAQVIAERDAENNSLRDRIEEAAMSFAERDATIAELRARTTLPLDDCPDCKGKGVVDVWGGRAIGTCARCDGAGRVSIQQCPDCAYGEVLGINDYMSCPTCGGGFMCPGERTCRVCPEHQYSEPQDQR